MRKCGVRVVIGSLAAHDGTLSASAWKIKEAAALKPSIHRLHPERTEASGGSPRLFLASFSLAISPLVYCDVCLLINGSSLLPLELTAPASGGALAGLPRQPMQSLPLQAMAMLNPLASPSQWAHTPSRADGIPQDLEDDLRAWGATVIQRLGTHLEL